MSNIKHDLEIAKNIGRYSDAVETTSGLRWLYTAGMPGMTATGEVPVGIEAQTRLVWSNLLETLKRARMTTDDLVKVTTSLINPADIETHGRVRAEILGEARRGCGPGSTSTRKPDMPIPTIDFAWSPPRGCRHVGPRRSSTRPGPGR